MSSAPTEEVVVRALRPEVDVFRELRLQALADSPDAYVETLDQARDCDWPARISRLFLSFACRLFRLAPMTPWSKYAALLCAMATLAASHRAAACLCEVNTVATFTKYADLVFVGRAYAAALVDQSAGARSAVAYRFAVSEWRKQEASRGEASTVIVFDNQWCPSINYLGQPQVVFAADERGNIRTDRCAGTSADMDAPESQRESCARNPSFQESLAASDAVFLGEVLSGWTDAKFESHVYQYRVFVRESWKGISVGQVVNVFEHAANAPWVTIGGTQRFYGKYENGQLVHDECSSPRPDLARVKGIEARERWYSQLDDAIDEVPHEHVSNSVEIPASEYVLPRAPEPRLPQTPPTAPSNSGAPTPSKAIPQTTRAPAALVGGYPHGGCGRCSVGYHQAGDDRLSALGLVLLLWRRRGRGAHSTKRRRARA